MKFSWIISVICLYYASIIFYCFVDNTPFWDAYFWIDTLLICILSLAFNFQPKKTDFELTFILFLIATKSFGLLYYIIGLATNLKWCDTNIFFIISCVISGFFGMIFLRYKAWKRNS